MWKKVKDVVRASANKGACREKFWSRSEVEESFNGDAMSELSPSGMDFQMSNAIRSLGCSSASQRRTHNRPRTDRDCGRRFVCVSYSPGHERSRGVASAVALASCAAGHCELRTTVASEERGESHRKEWKKLRIRLSSVRS